MSKNTGKSYQQEIGGVVEHLRAERGWTQAELARMVGTSQPAIYRIENGLQNVSLDMVSKLSRAFGSPILSVNTSVSQSLYIEGGKELHGEVTVNTSKNAAVGLLCASLLNSGKTTLKHLARIEEVFRIIEVLESIGVKCRWVNRKRDLEIIPPAVLKLKDLDISAARRTRSIIMLFGPLLHKFKKFRLPYAGGCSLGVRTIEPHLRALRNFGLEVDARTESGFYNTTVDRVNNTSARRIVLTERGDTVTENVLMAAALYPGKTTIVGASPNYM
ncbi:helix-turn-helix domain-containing protein, partial [Candidatus Saccharibacteria bacterium]|nr:helix-turn-helix domain-containing protein [Candidatus Saccharibacteria bacterium]